jgi:hypothetical protein
MLLAPVLAAAAVAAATAAPAAQDAAAGRAIEYLRATDAETGLDVLVALQIYASLRGDPRPAAIVASRRPALRKDDLERYGALLDLDKPPYPAVPEGALPVPTALPPAAASIDDDLTRRCPIEALSCTLSEACREFVNVEGSGGILTHQAVWLLFSRWRGCEWPPLDREERRRHYAARLLAEARADPIPSDLFFERLALLGHLGYAAAIEPRWIELLLASQQPDGCFPASATIPCHPHSTALALWALAGLAPAPPDR